MSAYSVGAATFDDESTRVRVNNALNNSGLTGAQRLQLEEQMSNTTAPTVSDGLAIIIKWVPGEVLGAYAALILASQKSDKDPLVTTSLTMLVLLALAAAAITVLGGLLTFMKAGSTESINTTKKVELGARGLLAALGFVLWSTVIPGSYMSGEVKDKLAAVAVPLAAVIFGLVAELLVLPRTIRAVSDAIDN